MILTPEQLAAIRKTLMDASTAVAVVTAGMDISDQELQRLVDQGYIDPAHLENLPLTAYQLGQLMAIRPAAKNMGYSDFQAYLKKNPIILSEAEQYAVKSAQQRAGDFCVGLGTRASGELSAINVRLSDELAQKFRSGIKEKVAENIIRRESVGKLRTELRQMSEDWARDWDRIAVTETQLAHQQGVIDGVVEEYGEDELLAKIPEPSACDACKKLYLDSEGRPAVHPASWWYDQGVANVGKKKADWAPVLGAVHPHCLCQLVHVPEGMAFDENGDLVPESMIKKSVAPRREVTPNAIDGGGESEPGREGSPGLFEKGGPYIGPRGGKWADPQHTIPWKIEVRHHPKIFGEERHQTYYVHQQKEGHVKLTTSPDPGDYGVSMPKKSVDHFVRDLAGEVSGIPNSGNSAVNAVIRGDSEFLGKGDDGLAFRVGDQVVKVSTTVPYQPLNPGHRTPEKAADMLRHQVDLANMLADKIEGIQRSKFVAHGDKGFQIKSYVTIPEKLTRDQLDQIQDIVLNMHKAGYSLNDSVQAGIEENSGKLVLFDVGKAAPIRPGSGIYSDEKADIDHLKRLYKDHGQEFVLHGVSEGQQHWDKVMEKWDGWLKKKAPARFMEGHLKRAAEMRRKEAKATLTGKKLEQELKRIEDDLEFPLMELDFLKEDQSKIEKSYKLHYRTTFDGLPISIENRKGSYRYWYDQNAKREGKTKMLYPYGYIRLTEGKDGDHVDCYLGPDEKAPNVYVVHQLKAPEFKALDEDKVMLGFDSAEAAKRAYLAHYDNPRFFGSMSTIPMVEFKAKITDPNMRGKLIKHLGDLALFEMIKSQFGGSAGLVGTGRNIGTMGAHGSPARTAGQNLWGAPPIKEHYASKESQREKKKQRHVIKLPVRPKPQEVMAANSKDGTWIRPKPYADATAGRPAVKQNRKWVDDKETERSETRKLFRIEINPKDFRR